MDNKKAAMLAVAAVAIIIVVAAAFLLLNNKGNNDQGGGTVDYLKDPSTGIELYDGKFPSGTVLEVIQLSGSDKSAAVEKTPSEYIDRDSAVAYSILAKKDGKAVEPKTKVEVVMPAKLANGSTVFLVSETPVIQASSAVSEGKLRFKSDTLGTFVIGAAPASSTKVTVVGENAAVSVNGGASAASYVGEFASGASVAIVSTPAAGYEFEGYYVGGSLVSSSPTYSFKVGSADTTINAVAKKAADKLVIDGGNSTIYVNGENKGKTCSIAMSPGTPVTAYAVADEGYVVSGWTGTYPSSSPVCSFEFGSGASLAVQTQAAPKGTSQVHVTTTVEGETAASYGSIVAYGKDVGSEYLVTLEQTGAPAQLSAASKAGFVFDRWMVDGQPYSGTVMNVTAGSEDMDVVAVFVPAPSHLVVATIDNGSVQIDGENVSSKSVKEGMPAVVKALPSDGYRFVGWFVGDKCVSDSAEYSLTMGNSDVKLEGRTHSTVFNVSLSVSNGTLEVDGVGVGTTYAGTVSEGDTIVFEALAGEGYVFSTWTMNGTVYNANKITVKGVSEDISAVAAMVKAVPRTVSASTQFGTVSIDGVEQGKAGSTTAYDGKEVTISVEVPYGYMLRGWTYDGKYVSTQPSFTFNVSGDMAFSAVVESTLHTVTVRAVNGGLIINSANIGSEYVTQLYMGESLIVNAAPSAGNTFSEWDVNGKKYGSSYQTIEIKMGSEDILATAYNVPMADGTLHIVAVNGTVKVGSVDVGSSHDIKASPGEEFELTAVPSPGYRFDHWTLDGDVSDYQIVKVTMGTEHVNAEAVMVKNDTHKVTVSIENGNLTYNGVDVGSRLVLDVEDKEVLLVKAKPIAGYALAGWYEGDVLVTIGSDYEFQVLHDTALTVKTVVKV